VTNAELARYYKVLSMLFERLAGLDTRQERIEVLKAEESGIDATRKQVQDEIAKHLASLPIDSTSDGAIPSGIAFPPSQPPV
jgi:hypothetical protein